MQGKKDYSEKLFTSFQLSERVPEDNFYRRLKEALDLSFMRELTKSYYGECGQKSIDPVVFMKLMLVGYLENQPTDRGLMRHCAMRLDILYFLGYDIDEPLPWFSTLSRTRALLPDDVFSAAFERVLKLCIEAGMVGGHTQAIDSAPIKANASMDSLELKVPETDLEEHLRRVRAMSAVDKQAKNNKQDNDRDEDRKHEPRRKAKNNKAPNEQRKVTATKDQLQEIAARNKKWSENQTERPGAKNNNSKYTSNKTHYSPTDPDARISVKPGKARKLNYHAQMAVDTENHVITHIAADFADKKDNQSLQQITKALQLRLSKEQLLWRNLLADAGYSSGDNYAFLEKLGIDSYIPPHGTYKGGPEGFEYHKDGNYWLCRNNKKVTFRKTFEEKGTLKNRYLTKRSDCKGCPFKTQCIPSSHEKRIDITYYNEEYQRAISRVRSKYGQHLKHKRSATVEPVFGTLTQFMGLRKINTRGIQNATKCMLAAAMAYNLKKLLKHTENRTKSEAQIAKKALLNFFTPIRLILSPYPSLNF